MPLVLMEAMSHGLPVISSDLPVSQEIMGDFGMYFSVGDVKGMARRMTEATQMSWQEKSEQALKIAERFNIETIIKQWKQLINER
jgi:glycosyltransferase involved in cell wall biosynthesis